MHEVLKELKDWKAEKIGEVLQTLAEKEGVKTANSS